MSEENKAVSRRFHAAIGKGSAQAVQGELASNFVAHFPTATTRRCSPTAGAERLIQWQEKGAAG